MDNYLVICPLQWKYITSINPRQYSLSLTPSVQEQVCNLILLVYGLFEFNSCLNISMVNSRVQVTNLNLHRELEPASVVQTI